MKVLLAIGFAGAVMTSSTAELTILTTKGPVTASQAGLILPHEHLFTDLRGPDAAGYGQADPADVLRVMKPLLEGARVAGVRTLVECTTIGVGRNVPVIARLAQESGMQIVVPTGVYGRANFAPREYAERSEEELAEWMIREITEGIDNTGIRAGFIKTAASDQELKPLEEKFLRASGKAVLATGVAVASHTTSGTVAARQADILERMGVPLNRFIWVHAQAEKDLEHHQRLAERGVYIELDSVGASAGEDAKIIGILRRLNEAGFGNCILISHDAGWYNPGQENGGKQRPFTALTTEFLPRLRKEGFADEFIKRLTEQNPFEAFATEKVSAAR